MENVFTGRFLGETCLFTNPQSLPEGGVTISQGVSIKGSLKLSGKKDEKKGAKKEAKPDLKEQ